MKTKLIITILFLLLLHSAVEAQSKQRIPIDCKWVLNECDHNPLNILHVLAYESIDSLKNYKMKKGEKYAIAYDCVNMMDRLFKNSKLKSNSLFDCHVMDRTYYSYGGKSIYTIDLLRLMRYYHSPDTVYVRSKVSGDFSVIDRGRLNDEWKWQWVNGAPCPNCIDTTILGR